MASISSIKLPDGSVNSIKASKIPFGQVNSTSTSTVFTATIDGITELANGVCCYLKNGVVTSAADWTLNINNLGAKPVYSTLAAASRTTTIFNINYTMLFIYNESRVDGGCWDIFYGYDSNTNTIGYQLRTNSLSLPVSGATYRYRILFTSADGTKFVPANTSTSTNATASRTVNQTKIDPFGKIVYYSYTTAVSANSRPGAAYLWEQYNVTLGYSFNRTGAALTLTSWEPVYIKCAPQTDGSAIIDSTTPYVQALPTTDDGKIYIFLGIATAATTVEINVEHPVYYYKNGAIRQWTNADIPTVPSNVSAFTNDAGYLTSESDPVFTASAAYGITSNKIAEWDNKVDFADIAIEIQDNCSKYNLVLYVNGSTAMLMTPGGSAVYFAGSYGFVSMASFGLETIYMQVLNGATDVSQAQVRTFTLTEIDMTTASVKFTSVDNGTIYTVDLQDTGDGLVGTYTTQLIPTNISTSTTIAVADWNSGTTCTKTVVGVTASNGVIIGPAPTSINAYSEAGVKCTAQATDSLTFTCDSAPSEAITVNILIIT